MTQLSQHFTLEEFIYSDTAKTKGIKNTPTDTHLKTMKHTCEYCLEPLRVLLNEKYNKTILTITSGYRSSALNKAINGATKSQHLTGEATDLQAYKIVNGKKIAISYIELYNNIKQWVKEGKLSIDQCILEKSNNATWVHISYSSWGSTKNRKQFLKYNNGVYSLDV